MAITKEKKKEIISDLKKMVSDSKSVVFVAFEKLSVKDSSDIRRGLKKDNIGYTVTKKSLLKKVLGESSVKGTQPELKGELALVFGEDNLAPAREIYDFQKKLSNKVYIVGGIFEGEFKSQDEMTNIAAIPSIEVLRGMFVNIINSPIQRFAIALNQIANKN